MEAHTSERTSPAAGAAEERDALRGRLHGMWSAVAPAWGRHAAYSDARGAEVAERMLERTAPAPGERVLELACGPAGLGLAAARRVAPGGEVVLSDVSAGMTAIAAARAEALGLANVRTRELDLEDIDEPDARYDVVLCREGMMFATDAGAAARETRRVLRPGGRVAIAVWGPRERNPWLGAVLDAAGAQLGRPVPPPGVPGPFSLSDRGRLGGLLSEAGLAEVDVTEVSVPLETTSFDEWWQRTAALAGPLSTILASMPQAGVDALRDRLQGATRPYRTESGGMRFPGVALLASARRP